MSTKTVIDEILPHCPTWNRTGTRGLLALVQRAQDELLDYDAEYMHFKDTGSNKGWAPYLHTTSGTYEYDITSANLSCTLAKTIGGTSRTVRCRRVVKVFIDSTNLDYARRWLGKPYLVAYLNPYTNALTRLEVADVGVDSEPALENTNAKVIFKEDPGTTTEIYFVDFIWEPPRLTAETIPLVVPQSYEAGIIDFVIGTVQGYSSGDPRNARMDHFYNYWKPRINQELGRQMATSRGNQTPARVC